MNCLCVINVDQNQQVFLAQMTSFVVRYDVIYHYFPINSQYLMTWGVDSPVMALFFLQQYNRTAYYNYYFSYFLKMC